MLDGSDARPAEGEDRRRQVRTIFTEIAPRYDLLNHLLSLNWDRRWRRRAVTQLMRGMARRSDAATSPDRAPGAVDAEARPRPDRLIPVILDCCAGTCDLALEIAGASDFGGRVVAADFALPMLEAAIPKVSAQPITLACADALQLPFPDNSFDGATMAFGLRNLADPGDGLRELRRVLRPGARLVVLEFTTPPNRIMRMGYYAYFKGILPVVGRIVSGHPWAYSYLPRSVGVFPGPEPLMELFRRAGFVDVEHELLSAGIAAMHWGQA